MNNITLSNLFKAFSDALLGKSDAETIQIPNGPNPEIFGVDDIKIGDRFYGYGCGLYWENQECTHINKEGFIHGTTTLCVFKKENILKY